ncbi:SPFH domain-containing protein [Candidatus Saccharibacteria bacterium]|nr:SPFH domain-containing protein [Candidatus Saccharibacteria bacterium]
MAITIILFVLCIAAIAAIFLVPMKVEFKKPNFFRGIVGAVALILLFLSLSIRVVNVGEILLVKEWGRPIDTKTPGMNIVIPVVNTTDHYTTRTKQIDMTFQAYSLDAQTMDIIFAVQYAVDPTQIIAIANTYGSQDALEMKISRVIEERAKVVFSSRSAMKIIETREALGPQLLEAIKKLETEYFIHITVAVASDISFSDAFENAVENKMLAEQAKLQAEYDKEKAVIKAEEQLEVAKRQADAAIAKANGDAEALTIMQNAWSTLSQPVKDAMLRQQFYEKWDGKLPQVMSDGSLIYDIGGVPAN